MAGGLVLFGGLINGFGVRVRALEFARLPSRSYANLTEAAAAPQCASVLVSLSYACVTNAGKLPDFIQGGIAATLARVCLIAHRC